MLYILLVKEDLLSEKCVQFWLTSKINVIFKYSTIYLSSIQARSDSQLILRIILKYKYVTFSVKIARKVSMALPVQITAANSVRTTSVMGKRATACTVCILSYI